MSEYRCPVCGIADQWAYLRCYRPDCLDGRDQYSPRVEAPMSMIQTAVWLPRDMHDQLKKAGGKRGMGAEIRRRLGQTLYNQPVNRNYRWWATAAIIAAVFALFMFYRGF